MLDGTHSVFGPEAITEETRARAAAQDIHPTGPMWGEGELRTRDRAREVEDAALAPFEDLRRGLESARIKQERRALRVRAQHLSWDWKEEGLELRFSLGPGAYATEVLAELGDIK
jgi:tRNA pseudouridine13 synthase